MREGESKARQGKARQGRVKQGRADQSEVVLAHDRRGACSSRGLAERCMGHTHVQVRGVVEVCVEYLYA